MSQIYYYPPSSSTLAPGAATAANQVLEIAALNTLISQLPNPIGAHTIAGSLSVNIASDQVVPVSLASSPLPPNAATASNQVLEIAALNTLISQLPNPIGAHVIAASLAVNIASDQIVPVSLSSVPLPTGAATAANQVLEIADLDSIDANINSRLSGSLVPTAYDEIDIAYVVAGPGAGQIQTATYKLASSTVKTVTITYDGSDRIATVVAS